MNKNPSYSSSSSLSVSYSPLETKTHHSPSTQSIKQQQQRSKIKTNGHFLLKSLSTSSFNSTHSLNTKQNTPLETKKLAISPYVSHSIETYESKIDCKSMYELIESFLRDKSSPQVCIITGSEGSGKTSFIETLINNCLIYNSNASTNDASLLYKQLVCTHLCRSDNIHTQRSDLFINNLITSLFNHSSKLFQNYKNYILNSNLLETYLFGNNQFIQRYNLIFEKLISEPLEYLCKLDDYEDESPYLIAIDSIDVCFNENLSQLLSDTQGDIGINNLARLIFFHFDQLFVNKKFKFILTTRSSNLHLIQAYLTRNRLCSFKYSVIDFDLNIKTCLNDFIKARLLMDGDSNRIKRNLFAFNLISTSSNSSFSDYNDTSIASKEKQQIEKKFIQFLNDKCERNFLYLKFLLDLIESNNLIIKSLNFNNLPKTLDEVSKITLRESSVILLLISFFNHLHLKNINIKVFQLKFNLVFKSTSNNLLSIIIYCLSASFYMPLSINDLYELVNHNAKTQLDWNEFNQQLDILISSNLIQLNFKLNGDEVIKAHVQFVNLTFKDWLWSHLHANKSNLLNNSHYLIAGKLFTKISRKDMFDEESLVKFMIHLRLSNLFDAKTPKFYAYFFSMLNLEKEMLESLALNSSILTLIPNGYLINILVLNGVNLLTICHQFDSQLYPLIQLYACFNYKNLLEFIHTSKSLTISNGLAYRLLICATEFGSYETCLHLIDSFKLNFLSCIPNSNWCVPLFAAKNNHTRLMDYYLSQINENKQDLLKQLCVVSCIYDRYESFCYLIESHNVNVNEFDNIFGETCLTAACSYGRKRICEYLFNNSSNTNACINQMNKKHLSPLLCAIKSNEWQLVEYLLTLNNLDIEQCDKYGRSALIIASSEGHLAIIDILIEKNADLERKDCDGLTALSWACLKGNFNAALTLIAHGANIHHEDDSGRSTLDLATFSGDFRLVQHLIDNQAQIEHADHIGMRPLDRAISCGFNEIVVYYLNKGAKLTNATWAVAFDKQDILLHLLNKLIDDGNRFYRKNSYQDALYRYTYAIKKFPSWDSDKLLTIKCNLYLNLARCHRKLNDYQNSIDFSTKAIELNPLSFEAFYTRARAKRDFHMYETALSDLYEAQHLNQSNEDVKKLITKVLIDLNKKSIQKSLPNSHSSLNTFFKNCKNETNI